MFKMGHLPLLWTHLVASPTQGKMNEERGSHIPLLSQPRGSKSKKVGLGEEDLSRLDSGKMGITRRWQDKIPAQQTAPGDTTPPHQTKPS